jgi:hypothetical protein
MALVLYVCVFFGDVLHAICNVPTVYTLRTTTARPRDIALVFPLFFSTSSVSAILSDMYAHPYGCCFCSLMFVPTRTHSLEAI